jgi:Flp pilus assembly protein TadG
MKSIIFKQDQDKESGQTLVEFALVCLLFFILIFGIIEFGRALWTWNSIVHATRTGARYAVVETPTADDSNIKKVVVYNDPNATSSSTPILPGLQESNVTVQYCTDAGTCSSSLTVAQKQGGQNSIQVSITGYQFYFVVPIFGSSITLPAFTTTMPLEGLGAT